MKLEEALALAGCPDDVQVFEKDWDASQASRPTGSIPFLEQDFLRRNAEQTYLSSDVTRNILETAERIKANAGLTALAWYCHERLFGEEDADVRVNKWPVPKAALGDLAGLFYAVILLSGTPRRQAIHGELGIPESIIRDSVRDLEVCIRTERTDELGGHCGINGRILAWLLLTWRGRLYRLGRLQFVPDRFSGKLRAFRHLDTGAVIALAEDGCRFRADGQFDGAGQIYDNAGAWTATLRQTTSEVAGFPITPTGHAVRREVCLDRGRWSQALAPGDPILAIHIPAGPPMDFAACGDSLRQALEFFPRYFPEKPFVAFVCSSWILDPQIQQLMPPTSNLVRFQKELYLYPLPGGSGEIPWQVRLREDRNTGTAPTMTTMQRAFYRHAEKGGRFYNAGGFLVAEDFEWGSELYRHEPLLAKLIHRAPETGLPASLAGSRAGEAS